MPSYYKNRYYIQIEIEIEIFHCIFILYALLSHSFICNEMSASRFAYAHEISGPEKCTFLSTVINKFAS